MKSILFIALLVFSLHAHSYESAHKTTHEALYQAAKAGDIKGLKTFLKDNKEQINAQDDQGYTALIYAAYYGQEEAVNFLLKSGADSCAKDKRGNTASMGAIFKGNFKIAKKLLNSKCGATEVNIQGQTNLMYAALFGRTEIARELLKLGEHPDQEDFGGMSARMLAVGQGNFEVLEIFEKFDKTSAKSKAKKDAHEELKRRVLIKEIRTKI